MKKLPTIVKRTIQPIDLVKYSGASGDFNEIHTVPEVAKKKGYDQNITHGMFLMGWSTSAISEWFPNRKIKRIQVRFQSPVYPGTELSIKGYWNECISENDYGVIEMIDSTGEIKLKGSFELKS